MKRCPGCQQSLPLDAFGISKREADGRQTRCRDCRRAYREANKEMLSAKKRAAYRAEPEATKARSRAWYAENRDRGLEARRAYYAANREHWRERGREWYRLNKDRVAEMSKKWRAANPHRKVDMEQSRRARAGGYFVEHVDRLELFSRHEGLCGICGEPIETVMFDVDHIVPVSRGGQHSYANTQPAHPRCNQSKKNRLMQELRHKKLGNSDVLRA